MNIKKKFLPNFACCKKLDKDQKKRNFLQAPMLETGFRPPVITWVFFCFFLVFILRSFSKFNIFLKFLLNFLLGEKFFILRLNFASRIREKTMCMLNMLTTEKSFIKAKIKISGLHIYNFLWERIFQKKMRTILIMMETCTCEEERKIKIRVLSWSEKKINYILYYGHSYSWKAHVKEGKKKSKHMLVGTSSSHEDDRYMWGI